MAINLIQRKEMTEFINEYSGRTKRIGYKLRDIRGKQCRVL